MSFFTQQADTSPPLAPSFSAGPTTGFAENFGAAFDEVRAIGQSVSRENNEETARSERRKLIEGTLGRPYDEVIAPYRKRGARFISPDMESALSVEDEEIEALKRDLPKDQRELILNSDQIKHRASEVALEKFARAREVEARSNGFGGGAGGFLGGMSGYMTDAPNIISMLFGASAGAGILRTAGAELLAGAASETAIQPFVQNYRADLGLPHGIGEAITEIGMAGLGGAAFGGGIKAAGKALGLMSKRELVKTFDKTVKEPTPNQKVIRDELEKEVVAEEVNPHADTPAGRTAHAKNLKEAEEALREGRMPEIADDQPFIPGRRAGSALDVDSPALKSLTVKVRDLYRKALDKKKARLSLGKITADAASEISEKIRQGGDDAPDLNGFTHVMDADDMRHAIKNHGVGSKEELRGQVPLTEEDFARVPEVLAAYDRVDFRGRADRPKNIVIGYAKEYPDGSILYVEEVRSRRKHLAFKSMWKERPGGSRRTDVDGKTLNPRLDAQNTLRDTAGTDTNISPAGPKNKANRPSDRPLAAPGLKSFRYQGRYGSVMIGAKDRADALREAARSIDGEPVPENLQEWSEGKYISVNQQAAEEVLKDYADPASSARITEDGERLAVDMRRLIDEHGDVNIRIADDGESVSLKSVLDDIAADETFTGQLELCLKGGSS